MEFDQLFVESEQTIKQFKTLDVFLKANCLILNVPFPGLKNDIDTLKALSKPLSDIAANTP